MDAILEPQVTSSQALIVTKSLVTISYMDSDSPQKIAFAHRLNELCDDANIPPKGQNRQTIVGKLFGVSQKGARKWLEGESIPSHERMDAMCHEWNVSYEWLATGRGQKRINYEPAANTPESHVLKIMENMTESEKYQVVKIATALSEPPTQGGKNGTR